MLTGYIMTLWLVVLVSHGEKYRNSGNFRVRKFRAKNFRVKIFSWSTMAHENILTTKNLHAQNFL